MPTIRSSISVAVAPMIDWGLYEHGILESANSVRFIEVGKMDFDVDVYTSGLLFGEEAEVRWRKLRDGRFHLVFIDNSAQVEGTWAPLIQERPSQERISKVLLWGEASAEGTWSEGRIPGLLTEYPVKFSGMRLAIETVHYRLETAGEEPVFLFRCRKLATAEGE